MYNLLSIVATIYSRFVGYTTVLTNNERSLWTYLAVPEITFGDSDEDHEMEKRIRADLLYVNTLVSRSNGALVDILIHASPGPNWHCASRAIVQAALEALPRCRTLSPFDPPPLFRLCCIFALVPPRSLRLST